MSIEALEARNDFDVEAFVGSLRKDPAKLYTSSAPVLAPIESKYGDMLGASKHLDVVELDLSKYIIDTPNKKQKAPKNFMQPIPVVEPAVALPEPVKVEPQPLPKPTVIQPDQLTQTTRRSREGISRRDLLLGVAATTVLGGVFGTVLRMDKAQTANASPNETTTTSNSTTTTEAPTTTTTEAPTTTTTEAPAPHTTEAPAPTRFEAKPGDVIGVLSVPGLDENEIQVYEFAESEIPLIDSGAATIDKLIPNADGVHTSKNADEYEAALKFFTGRDFLKRSERLRSNIATPQNPKGNVSYYKPVAGHEQRTDGQLISVYPGQGGNSWFIGHGSMFSAPFANSAILKPGSEATFTRSDGKKLHYVMIEAQILPGNNDEAIRLYNHPNYSSTLTFSNCSDKEGRTGDKTHRYVTRWGLVAADNK